MIDIVIYYGYDNTYIHTYTYIYTYIHTYIQDTLLPVLLTEFDHLITKPKLSKDDNYLDHLSPNTKVDVLALGDPGLATLKQGDVIQIERRYIYTYVCIGVCRY